MNEVVRNVRLQPNRRKLLEAILFLIHEGEARGTPLTQYQIVKSIFLADVAHLNAYGRPVTFDNYHAMEFGPVPSEAYNMLKPEFSWGLLNLPHAPWERDQVSRSSFHYVRPSRAPDLRALSKSDLDALRHAYDRVREAGFGRTRDETHAHPAYIDAWDRRGRAKSAPMDYAKLLEVADQETIEDIAFASKHARG